ncbi:unnamed protein product [Dibothriocephalus latus]|uniref:RRM domain-containing protein n=1 Tax=Dibothriocephalus latus TaxID=60516 RepID=A0A3P6QWK8_DIBLA|nr:unnamed protein product [Dibothriocephalus latus]
MEPMDSDDASFYPCPCLYQVCRFCWAKILNEENGLCPACRQVCLDVNPPNEKKKVIQTNLVFVVGLPQWISKDKEILKNVEYFGQFGKVFKVEVNPNPNFTNPQLALMMSRAVPLRVLISGNGSEKLHQFFSPVTEAENRRPQNCFHVLVNGVEPSLGLPFPSTPPGGLRRRIGGRIKKLMRWTKKKVSKLSQSSSLDHL